MSDTVLIVIAVLAVLVVGFLVMRSRSDAGTPAKRDQSDAAEEGNGVSDGFAAATEDVVGEFVGVEAHPDFPGDDEVRHGDTGSGARASTARGGAADDLTKIKGLGPKAAEGFNRAGVVRFEQIAGWSEGDIDTLANRLGRPELAERIRRDRWVEQAGLLARGETAAFEEKFGKIG